MKKALSLFLALMLCATLAVPLMAAESETDAKDYFADAVEIKIPGLDKLYSLYSGNSVAQYKDFTIKIAGEAAKTFGYYYYAEGQANVVSENSPYHFAAKNYIFIIPAPGYFGFSDNIRGFKDSVFDYWTAYSYEAGELADYNNGRTEAVIKLRFEDNKEMQPSAGLVSAVNIFFVLTSDTSKSYGEKRPISELSSGASAPTTAPAPVSVPKLESVSESTIEIPDSNGTRFTFSNIHNGFVGEYDSLDGGLMFGYANSASVICNKDVYLYEFTASNNGVSFYHYYTYKYDQGKLLKTFAAGTAIDVSSMTPENSEYSLDKMTFVTQNKSGYGRQIHLYPANTILEWGADDPDIFYPLSLFAVEKQPEPKPEVGIPSAWAVNSVNTAKSLGLATPELTNGYQAATTRAEFCRAAVNFLRTYGFDVDSVTPKLFNDTNDTDIGIAAALGITSGTDAEKNLFSPNGTLTREQAATMLRNVMNVIGLDTSAPSGVLWTDANGISSWAQSAVDVMYNAKIMNGTSSTSLVFSPKTSYTHEQSIITLVNLWEYAAK